ncbi:hypothetical protein CapIbe_015073 [Capra ibex]
MLPNVLPSLSSGSSLFSSSLTLALLLLIILSQILAQWPSQLFSGDPVLTTVAVLLLLLITGVTVIIWRQPQDPSPLPFRVPALPVLPLVSIFMNVHLWDLGPVWRLECHWDSHILWIWDPIQPGREQSSTATSHQPPPPRLLT